MSNQTANVPLGISPTLINSGLAVGSIIYNQDSKNQVWLSSDPSLTSGTGIPLGSLGSLTWKGGPVYAVADKAATGTVMLNISGDVSNLDNPVAIGAAVAAQLLQSGVPNVLIGKTIFNGVVPNTTKYWDLPVSVGQYASVLLNMSSSVNQCLSILWVDSATQQTVSIRTYNLNAYPVDSNTLQLELPVKADILRIGFTDLTVGAVTLTAYASNRPLVEKVGGAPPYYLSNIANFAYAAYQTQVFPKAFYSAGGMHSVHLTPNAGNVTGYFGMFARNSSGTEDNLTIFDSSVAKAGTGGETEMNMNIILPAGYYRLWWQNGGTAMTYPVAIQIYPTT